MKVVVFDFDETLGEFSQLGDFVEMLERYFHKPIKREILYKLIDIYPFTLRHKLFNILNYIKKLKKARKINKVIIFTNNMGPRAWVLAIKTYLEQKLNFPLFDRIISAYKVGGIQIEKKRTSHAKTWDDLVSCGNLPLSAQILFFDDQEHPIQHHPNVTYFKISPYSSIMNPKYMVGRFLHSRRLKSLIQFPDDFTNFMLSNLKYTPKKPNIHPQESKEIINFIKQWSD